MLDVSNYQVGASVSGKALLKEGKTTPPKRFIEADLVDIMDDCGRYAEIGKEDMAILRQKNQAGSGKAGIGTARTRGEIIKGLFEKELIVKVKEGSKTYIEPTEKGEALYNVLMSSGVAKTLASPEMTAKWEVGLEKIEKGEITVEQFMAKLIPFVEQMVIDMTASPTSSKSASKPQSGVSPHPKHGSDCPKCGSGKLTTGLVTKESSKSFGQRYVRCDNKASCDYFGEFIK